MTKAHFKDGATANALAFFQDKIAKVRELKEQRERMLLEVFDAAFEGEDLTFDQFRQRYLQLV